VLREHAGKQVFDAVEALRKGHIGLRQQDNPRKRRRLQRLMESLDASKLVQVIRAFSIYFSLVNVAEEVKQPEKNMPKGILWIKFGFQERDAPPQVLSYVSRQNKIFPTTHFRISLTKKQGKTGQV